ncbi:hypothetical protein TNIN_33241 [Trichonephila inaurata madagascariensis]|uniref:Uncharacterized protein n=1 Tax=Trichonephila inaurata madagascariensis TaxID=2747483 RepID=A0A8X6YA55_9ARAC|nr:hypothetical protein TNIN_33241 [Trichonephila inaurata madagascariensis]
MLRMTGEGGHCFVKEVAELAFEGPFLVMLLHMCIEMVTAREVTRALGAHILFFSSMQFVMPVAASLVFERRIAVSAIEETKLCMDLRGRGKI